MVGAQEQKNITDAIYKIGNVEYCNFVIVKRRDQYLKVLRLNRGGSFVEISDCGRIAHGFDTGGHYFSYYIGSEQTRSAHPSAQGSPAAGCWL